MGIEIPEALQWVAKYVVGAGDWPEGDETAMRRVESAWTQLATDLREIGPDANHAIDQVLAAIEGDTAKAISDRWTELGHGAGAFDGLIEHIETLGDEIGDGAADIEHTKLVILASLAIFAVEMAVALTAAATGIGAPAAAAEAAVAQTATRIAIRTAIKQLLQRILSKAALKAAARAAVRGAWAAALEEVGLDLGVKAVQVATGRRDEITVDDLKEAGKTAVTAAATGAVTGAMGPDGLTSRNVPGGPEGGNPLANAAKDGAQEAVAGVAGEVAGEATDAALNDREFSLEQALSPENLTSSAVGGIQRGTETLGENNSTDTGENQNNNDEDPPEESQNNNPPDNGDRETQGRNQSQEQQQNQPPAPNTQPPAPEGPTQTQSSSSSQQPPGEQQPPGQPSPGQQPPTGQPPETGDQPASQDPPSPSSQDGPPQQTPAAPEPGQTQPAPETQQPQPTESRPPDTPNPQSTEPGPPDSQQARPTDTGSPAGQQPQGTDPGEPNPPQSQQPNGGSPDTPQSTHSGAPNTPDTATAPGTQQQPTSSLNLPSASSLNLGPETTTSPETGSPTTTPGTPQTPPTPDTATNQTPPTTPGETTTAGTPGTTPVAGAPQAQNTPPPSAPATPETAAPETTPTTTSAATATPTVPPPGPAPTATAPADTPRSTSPTDAATGTHAGTTPANAPRNQSRAGTPQQPGDATTPGDARPQGTDRTPDTLETAPNTPGFDYNIYDPANHARLLADFSRPPIPARPTNSGPTHDRSPSTPDRAGPTDDPSKSPRRTDAPTPNPNRPRPGDPIWNATDQISAQPPAHPTTASTVDEPHRPTDRSPTKDSPSSPVGAAVPTGIENSKPENTDQAPTDRHSSPVATAGSDPSSPSLPESDHYRPDGSPVPTNELVHPDLETSELERISAIDERLREAAQEYRDKHGTFPPPPPGVGRPHPAVEAMIPSGFDPYHGMGRDQWMDSITDPDGNLNWADATQHPEGFSTPTDRHPVVLPVGEIIDRFGGPNGRFTSPPGVTYPERALPPTNLEGDSYHQYRVVRPLPVWMGQIAPQMGEIGLGTQHFLPSSVQALVEAGYLEEVSPEPRDTPPSSSGIAPENSPDDWPSDEGPSRQSHPLNGRPGFSLMSENDNFYRFAQHASPLPGHYDVIAHGSPDIVEMNSGGNRLSARELANIISHRPDYQPGMPVRLLSCNTGHLDGNVAVQLAQSLNTTVVAPDGYLYINSSGTMGVDRRPSGEIGYIRVRSLDNTFHRFHPDGSIEEMERNEWEG
ncbi:glycohydrolase toxin TNT-related protein [Nocardia sp. NPDC019395]|uniref:glycohydrolase toxin TNT-related protein n=1 Tax=Nocardia sp. NPDC019395 TaxID=3154686 RepID=UPI0033E020FA